MASKITAFLRKIKAIIRITKKQSIACKSKRFTFRRTIRKRNPEKENSIEQGFINMLKFK